MTLLLISNWLYNTLYILYLLLVASSIFVVISENRNPSKSLAWILALMFLPVVGLVLYLFFGQSLRNERMLSKQNRLLLQASNKPPKVDLDSLHLSDNCRRLLTLCHKLGHASYYPGNDVRMYIKGHEKFADLIADLRSAERFIHMQYFIFRDDQLGSQIRDELVAAVQRGVEVRVLFDDMGSWTVRRRFFRDMQKKGVDVHPFMRVAFPNPSLRINYRNHRKIVVIDGKIGYIGGMNVADRYVNGDDDHSWRDTHLRIEGPAVHGLQLSFAVDWSYECKTLLSGDFYFPQIEPTGDKGIQIITSGPIGGWESIALMCQKIVSMARRYVYIQTPYFLPTDTLINVLSMAALSGIDVRIMIPNRPDSIILRWGSFSYIAQMLQAGVKIFLYLPGVMHAKTIVADDELVSIGSANFDFRSFEHNFETNALVYNAELALRVKTDFHNDATECQEVNASDWQERPWAQKVCESVVRLISPVL